MIKVFSVLNRIKVKTLSIHSNSLLQIPDLSKVFVRYFNLKAPNYISNSRSFLPKISQSFLLKYGDNAEKCRMLAEHSAPSFFLQCYDDKDSSQMRVALNLKKKNPKKDNLQGILTDSLHLYNSNAKNLDIASISKAKFIRLPSMFSLESVTCSKANSTLKYLSINTSRLQSITENIYKIQNLEELYINDSDLKIFDIDLSKCKKLQLIQISN